MAATRGSRKNDTIMRHCEACGAPAKYEHHIVNQGIRNSQGCDCPVNKIWLCYKCHTIAHAIGRWAAFQKFKMLERLMRALEHRNERNRGTLPCSPKWARQGG